MFSMAAFSCLTYSMLMFSWLPASLTDSPAFSAASAVFLAFSEMSAMVADSSSTALACSVAP